MLASIQATTGFCVALALTTLACSADVDGRGSSRARTEGEERAGEGGDDTARAGGQAPDAGTEAQPDGCDDADPCTLDEHPPGYCVHTWICRWAGDV